MTVGLGVGVGATAPVRSRSAATGAVVAQLSQAIGSFFLQIQAARLLGREGLAQFALLYGLIVVGTAVSTGLVGDALTVLDRHTPTIRAGLQWWATRIVVLSSLGLAALVAAAGELNAGDAVWFAFAVATFLAEDLVRRVLMASMRFWAIVVVDGIVALGSVGLVAAVHLAGGEVVLHTFLMAMVLGQTAAGLTAWVMLTPVERHRERHAAADRAAVWRYGSWRALQHAVRPVTLAVVRVVAIAMLGRLAFGELEAARLFIAPAILAVNGASNYLFASFASSRTSATAALLRRADRGVGALLGASLLIGAFAVALLPWFGGLVATDDYQLGALDVGGWALFAAATAAVTPYGVLAAVRVRQARVFAIRAVETFASVVVVVVVLALGGAAWTVPVVLAVCSALAGWAIRSLISAEDSP